MSTPDPIVRFSWRQRLEHLANLLLFSLLALTGFPQKLADSTWLHWVVDLFGGVANVRFVHRVCGVLFTLLTLEHFAIAAAWLARRKSLESTIVPTRRDFTDAIATLRYYLGAARAQPPFDRFDYRQKFEYWGLIFGSLVMVASGLILFYPAQVAALTFGQIIPAAKAMHSNEGVMAFLVVVVWHIYNAVLSPEVFPLDTAIFTGRISRKRMQHEHPLELARLDAAQAPAPEAVVPPTAAPAAEPGPEPKPGG